MGLVKILLWMLVMLACVAGASASMTVFMNDTFTETSDTGITLHIAETGQSYTILNSIDGGNGKVEEAGDFLATNNAREDYGYLAVANESVASNSLDYDLYAIATNNYNPGNAEDNLHLLGRVVDVNNFYGLRISESKASTIFYKRVGGVKTDLISGPFGLTADDIVKVSFRGSNISIFVNNVFNASVIDGSLNGTKFGLGSGASPSYVNDDVYSIDGKQSFTTFGLTIYEAIGINTFNNSARNSQLSASFNYTHWGNTNASCRLYINGTANTTETPVPANQTNVIFNSTGLIEGDWLWNIQCNTTSYITNSSLYTYSYVNAYPTISNFSVVERQRVFFNLSVQHSIANNISNVTLTLNSTNYTITSSDGDWSDNSSHVRVFKSITMPYYNLPAILNLTYNWTVNFTMGSTASNSSVIRIYKVLVDNCSLYSMKALNMTIKRYTDNTTLTGDLAAYVPYSNYYGVLRNFSFANYNKGSNYLCVFPNWSQAYSDLWLEYNDTGYEVHNYFTYNTTINKTMQNILLFLVNGTSNVTFYVRDENDNVVSDVYINVMKFEADTGSYYTTQIIKTDEDGKAIGNIVMNTAWYKFILSYSGEILLETSPTIISSTPKTFRVSFGNDYFITFNNYRGIYSNLTYTNATSTFRFAYYDPAGVIHQGCLYVARLSSRNGTTELSRSCISSAGGVITYVITENKTGKTYLAQGYVVFDDHVPLAQLLLSFRDSGYGKNGLLVSFMLVVALTFLGLWNPIVALILCIIGIVVSSFLGMWQWVDYGMMVLMLIPMIFAIYLMGRKGG